MADGIASYWSSFSGEAFQVYEKNGTYQDPIFDEAEQQVMQKAKRILNIELAAGVLLLAITLAIYIYLYRSGFRDALRNRSRVGPVSYTHLDVYKRQDPDPDHDHRRGK